MPSGDSGRGWPRSDDEAIDTLIGQAVDGATSAGDLEARLRHLGEDLGWSIDHMLQRYYSFSHRRALACRLIERIAVGNKRTPVRMRPRGDPTRRSS